MKMKLNDVVFLYETLNKIADMPSLVDAPIEVKFMLVRNARITQPFHIDFMQQRRDLLLANSSPKEEGSDDRMATPEQLKYINDEIEKLSQLEVEVPVVTIKLKDLESLKLDMSMLSGLYPLILDGKV